MNAAARACLVALLLLIVAYVWYASRVEARLAAAYRLPYPHHADPFDRTQFHEFNPSLVRYQDDYLTASRLDNRCVMQDRGLVWIPWRKYRFFQLQGYWLPFSQNYIALRHADQLCHVLELPATLPGIHPEVRWFEQYEDPRVFVHPQRQCVFVTATVFNRQKLPRIALLELHPDTLTFQRGVVLTGDGVLSAAEQARPQKNWVLFADRAGQVKIMTDACPQLRICHIDLDHDFGRMTPCYETDTKQLFSNYRAAHLHVRCSTGPIAFTERTLICALHVREKTTLLQTIRQRYRYRTLFLELQNQYPYEPVQISRLYSVTHDRARIEFAAGLCWHRNGRQLRLAVGLNDRDHRIVNMDPATIFTRPGQAWNDSRLPFQTELNERLLLPAKG